LLIGYYAFAAVRRRVHYIEGEGDMTGKLNGSWRSSSMLTSVLAACVVLIPLTAQAQYPYDSVIAFGDSLLDNGNLFALSGNAFPPPPYFQGRFSNGPVSPELLAARLGVPLIDNAFGGAFTDTHTVFDGTHPGNPNIPGAPGMQGEVSSYVAAHPAVNPNALYIVWGGANDYLNGGQTNPFIPVGNLTAEITSLASHGARYFLIPNLPDLGSLPATIGTPFSTPLNQLTAAHNQILAGSIQSLQTSLPGDRFFLMDDNSVVASIQANPAAFGFTDATHAYLSNPVGNPNNYLFWDIVHPTSPGQSLLANLGFAAVTPEPGTVGLLAGLSITGAGIAFRRKRRSALCRK
jgi:phospholipase/lecithinase/hemolysin